jgi:SAM-dependent methyltransferase
LINPDPSRFERVRRCPACGSGRFRAFRKGTFDDTLLNAERIKITDSQYGKVWDLALCLDCSHLFADPSPRSEFIFSLYRQVEDPLYDAEAEGRSQNFRGILDHLERMRPRKGRLFDVGAATGILLDLARRRGWRVDGIDASGWAARRAAEHYRIPLRQGIFEEAALPASGFEAVTMIDFIEHTPSPQKAIAQAARVLAPGGILCLVTPDIHSLAARLAGPRWWHLRPGHLAYFSRGSLSALLGSAGFRIVSRRRYAWTFSALYLVSRFRMLGGLSASRVASFLKRIPIKLALGDSFEIYAMKDKTV